MDLFNRNPVESEKAFLNNRMRAIFGSNEMLIHGVVKILLALLFIFGSFSKHISIMGFVFFAFSAVSTFLMFSKMQKERKYSPLGARVFSVFTLIEGIAVKIYLLAYCAFIISAMFGRSLFGKYTEEAAIIPYKMGFWCIPVVIAVVIIFANVSQFFKYQKRFADNIFDCVDMQLVFYSTEKKYSFQCYLYAFIIFLYNLFKLLCSSSSWYEMNVFPAKFAEYLDSGIIIKEYKFLTFIALILLSVHFVMAGRLSAKYINVLRKLRKKVKERHAS